MVAVEVAVDDHLGPRGAAPVDDRRVVELIGEDRVAGAGQRADHAEVGEVARAEQHTRLAALELREALLQAAVDRHRPGHQSRGARAHAPAHRRVGCGLAHLGMVGEPEVVVRAQQQYGLAVEQHRRSLRPRDQTQATTETESLQFRQALLDLAHPGCRLADRHSVRGAIWARGNCALGAESQLARRIPQPYLQADCRRGT